MIYQPTFPSPHMETIDANAVGGNVFKCLINPKNTIVGYECCIKKINQKNDANSYVGYIRGEYSKGLFQKYLSINNDAFKKIEISSGDSILPLKGSLTDESWLNIVIPKELPLENNQQYHWSVKLYENVDYTDDNFELVYECYIDRSGQEQESGVEYAGYIGLKDAMYDYNTDIKPELYKMFSEHNDDEIWISNYYNKTKARVLSYDLSNNLCTGISYDTSGGASHKFSTSTGDQKFYFYILSSNLYSLSPDYYFKTRTTPILEFNVPEVITSLVHNFTATYSQEQNSNISYYKFELYNDGRLIDETEEMYSSDISYSYGGFLHGKAYTIKLTVEDENGFVLNEERTFDVAYETYQSYAEPKVSFDYKKSCVNIDYSAYANIDGKITNGEATYKNFLKSDGTTPEESNGISLAYNQELSWDNTNGKPLNLDDTSIVLHWHADKGFTGTIVELEDRENYRRNVKVWYDGLQFHYTLGTLPEITYSPYTGGTESAISDGTVTIDETKGYVLNDTDVLQDTDVLVDYDIANEFWWYIIITPLEVKFIQSTRYSDTEVTE